MPEPRSDEILSALRRLVTEAEAGRRERADESEPDLPNQLAKARAIGNEQTKLTATIVNNVAASFAIVGFVTPLARFLENPAPLSGGLPVALSAMWVVAAAVLQLFARLILRGLEP
jgi:hypothetical protein